MARKPAFTIAAPMTASALGDALALLFSRFEGQQATEYQTIYEAAIQEGTVRPEWVLEAREAGHLLGAALYQLQPGRTALVWPPRLAREAPPSAAEHLMAELIRRLQLAEVRLANTLLNPVQPEEHRLLATWQFAYIADLIYLVSFQQDFPFSKPVADLEYEAYDCVNHSRLARVVLATYEGSLDCPALDGVRDIEDVLAGYRGTGTFQPDHWAIVRHQGQDVGCVLVADHPREDCCELVYMGVTAAARGRGWGRQLVRWAQWQTRQAGRCRLVAAVDAANHPALDVYASLGFSAWDRRQCYARVFSA